MGTKKKGNTIIFNDGTTVDVSREWIIHEIKKAKSEGYRFLSMGNIGNKDFYIAFELITEKKQGNQNKKSV